MAILDGALGLVALRTPLESETVSLPVRSGVTLYPGQPVILNSGEVDVWTAGQELLGRCMDYATGVVDNSVEVTVCTSASMTYRIKGNSDFAITNVGQFCDMVSATAAKTATRTSAVVANTASLAASAGVDDVFQVVGEYKVVTPETTVQWFEVRLHTLTFAGQK